MSAQTSSQNVYNSTVKIEADLLIKQFEIIKGFFQTDSCREIIESVNLMIEGFLFDECLENVTPKMRIHIDNQLRVVTLLTKLNDNYKEISAFAGVGCKEAVSKEAVSFCI
jgi:hypothetical protein